VQQHTRLKNRVQATLSKYASTRPGISDLFGRRGRLWWQEQRQALPPTAYTLAGLLDTLEVLSRQIDRMAQRMHEDCIERWSLTS
jgi:hypothetical protein